MHLLLDLPSIADTLSAAQRTLNQLYDSVNTVNARIEASREALSRSYVMLQAAERRLARRELAVLE